MKRHTLFVIGALLATPAWAAGLSENEARDMATAYAANHLANKPACLSYVMTDNNTEWVVDIHDVHNAACGGNTKAQHVAASVAIDKQTRKVTPFDDSGEEK